jgi:hypothetical protein
MAAETMAGLTVSERVRFEAIWLLSRRGPYRRGTAPPRSDVPAAPILTTVIRLPPETARSVHAATKALRDVPPEHYHYPPETLHVTVRNLDRVAGVERSELVSRLVAAVASIDPFEIVLRGLNLSPSTAFVQVAGCGRAMKSIRAAVAGEAQEADRPGVLWRAAGDLLWSGLAFSNVVRFRQPVSRSLTREVSRLRHTSIDRFVVREIELVQTDKLLSVSGTQIVSRLALRGGEAGLPSS